MKNGIKLILRYLMAVAVWGLINFSFLWFYITFFARNEFIDQGIGPFFTILISTIVAAYCLQKEQRVYLGIILAIWIVFGLIISKTGISPFFINYYIIPTLVASLFHYLNNTNLAIRYVLGIVFIFILVPFLTGENNPESGLVNLFRSFLEINDITNKFLILIWTSSILIYFGTTIACSYLLPIPHRFYFGLSIMILGIIPRLFWLIKTISHQSDVWPTMGALWAFGSFALGVIAADLLLYRQQKNHLQNQASPAAEG